MIATQIQKLFSYNDWAWDQVFEVIEAMDKELYVEPRPVYWGSIHGLLVHALCNEHYWLARIKREDPGPMFVSGDYASFEDVIRHWMIVRSEFHRFLDSLEESDYSTLTVENRNPKGNGFTLPLLDVLFQVINHATEHRGQITQTLHDLQISTHSTLDYIRFCIFP